MIDTATLESLLRLPASDRLALVEALWASLASHPDVVPVPGWHAEIVGGRLDEDEATTDEGESWSELRGRVERGA